MEKLKDQLADVFAKEKCRSLRLSYKLAQAWSLSRTRVNQLIKVFRSGDDLWIWALSHYPAYVGYNVEVRPLIWFEHNPHPDIREQMADIFCWENPQEKQAIVRQIAAADSRSPGTVLSHLTRLKDFESVEHRSAVGLLRLEEALQVAGYRLVALPEG